MSFEKKSCLDKKKFSPQGLQEFAVMIVLNNERGVFGDEDNLDILHACEVYKEKNEISPSSQVVLLVHHIFHSLSILS